MEDKILLIKIFVVSFVIASVAGLARLLRSYPTNEQIPYRVYISAMLNSGVFGLIIALLWYHSYSDNLTFLIGISALAGVGGITLFDFLLLFIQKKIGIKIVVDKKGGINDDE